MLVENLLVDFIVVTAVFILFTESGKAEFFTFDTFYFAEAVEVHTA